MLFIPAQSIYEITRRQRIVDTSVSIPNQVPVIEEDMDISRELIEGLRGTVLDCDDELTKEVRKLAQLYVMDNIKNPMTADFLYAENLVMIGCMLGVREELKNGAGA